MLKKFISILLCLTFTRTLSTSALAAETSNSEMSSFKTSETGRMEIVMGGQLRTGDAQSKIPFEVRQYENDEIVQIVKGQTNGESLLVMDYQNGELVHQETRLVSDVVVKNSATTEIGGRANTFLGSITYKADLYTGMKESVNVYSGFIKADNEGYTIRATLSDTLAFITSGLISYFASFIIPAAFWERLGIAVISTAGGNASGGAIGIIISENVSVLASYYDLYAYHGASSRYTSTYRGVAMQVKTIASAAFNEFYYDGFTPRNWQNNLRGSWFWGDLFGYTQYPNVDKYA